jgi:hypothetical protein
MMAMLVLYIALLFLSLLTGTTFSQSSGESGTFLTIQELKGQVVDASGNGIIGVRVFAIPMVQGEGLISSTATDSTGYYVFDLLPGNYTVMAKLPGYSFTASEVRVQAAAAPAVPEITGYPA